MYESSPSSVSVKGLTTNSQASQFADLDVLSSSPTVSAAGGIWGAGTGGDRAPYRIKLFPYCEGNPGSMFRMRLYGWDHIGVDPFAFVWLPYLIAEFTCIACTRGGPPAAVAGQQAFRLIAETERFCDTMTLTAGTLGVSQVDGVVCSTGPGTNLIAWAIVDLAGCRKFQFDFEQTDPVTMNVLWSKA